MCACWYSDRKYLSERVTSAKLKSLLCSNFSTVILWQYTVLYPTMTDLFSWKSEINSKLTDFLPGRRRSKVSSSKENTRKSSLQLFWKKERYWYITVKKILFAVFTVAAGRLSWWLFTFHNWSLFFSSLLNHPSFDPSFACCEGTLRNAVLVFRSCLPRWHKQGISKVIPSRKCSVLGS